MKKAFKIFVITLGVIVALLLAAAIVIPVLFKDQMLTAVKTEINKSLKAQVEFSDFRLSLLRHFPNLSFQMDDLSVIGTGVFEKDTLAGFRLFDATVNLMPLIRGEGIQVRSVLIDRPVVMARALEDGSVNWDIMIPSEEKVEEETDTAAMEMPAMRVELQKFEIREGRIAYYDEVSNMAAMLEPLDFVLSGDMNRELTTLEMDLAIGALDVEMDGVKYLNRARAAFGAIIAADLNAMEFTLKENELQLNEIVLGLEGTAAMKETGYPVDLRFYAKETSFKSLLSMVPAMYTKDFAGLETSGSLSLEGNVTGEYSTVDTVYPDMRLTLLVNNAMFRYPDLPRSVEGVNIDTRLFVDGHDMDRSIVDVERFSFRIGDNPFTAGFHVRTPVSDPELSGEVNGRIDLGSLADAIPMEETTLEGILDVALTFGGRMSWIEQEDYEKFTADGSLKLENFVFNTPALPVPVQMPVAGMFFSPRYVEVSRLDLLMGESDMHFTGRMENFIPYVFRENETVRGRFAFSSSMLNLNELIPETEEAETEEEDDTLALSVIEVPGNVDFELISEIKKIQFGNMDISDMQGWIIVRDKKVVLDQLLLNILNGTVGVTGAYYTEDMEKPSVELDLDVRDLSIPAAYNSFVTIQKLAPLAAGLEGNMLLGLKYNSMLGSDLMPVLSTVNGEGSLRSNEVTLVNVSTFDRIRSMLKLREDLTNRLKDINILFRIVDGNLLVEPFEIKMGGMDMVVGGRQGLDQRMDFLVKMSIPRSYMGEGAERVVDNLVANAASRGLNITPADRVNVDVRITGTVKNPDISLSLKESMQGAVQELKSQVREQAEAMIEEKKEEVKEKLEEKKEEVVDEARERAQQIIERAEKARDEALIRAAAEKDKAYAEADRIEQEAGGNMVEKLKARARAEGIRKAADAVYNKSREIAENEYQQALERARKGTEKK